MTGHHGWGYGQKDGRRRPRLARIRGDSPPDPRARPRLAGPANPVPFRPDWDPHPIRPPEPGPPAQPEPRLPGAWRQVRAAPRPHDRRLRCAASSAQPPAAALTRTRAAKRTHSPLAGSGDGGDPAPQGEGGRSGAERCAWVRGAGCAGISRSPAPQGQGRSVPGRVSLRGVRRLPVGRYRREWIIWVPTYVPGYLHGAGCLNTSRREAWPTPSSWCDLETSSSILPQFP